MYQISLSTVASWQSWSNFWIPTSIDTLCPSCNRLVNFPVTNQQHDPQRNTISATGRCPGCGKNAHFWIVEPGDGRDSSKRGCANLSIYPKPRTIREPIIAGDKMNTALARSYQSAIAAYNAGLWTAAATSCRRTLEGLVRSLLGENHSKEPLFQQLKALPEKVNLSEPLILLAENLRKGGNVAAHFDLEKEPDQPVAEAMLDLLDYFVEYIYVLKEKAQDLEKRLDSLGK